MLKFQKKLTSSFWVFVPTRKRDAGRRTPDAGHRTPDRILARLKSLFPYGRGIKITFYALSSFSFKLWNLNFNLNKIFKLKKIYTLKLWIYHIIIGYNLAKYSNWIYYCDYLLFIVKHLTYSKLNKFSIKCHHRLKSRRSLHQFQYDIKLIQ